MNRLRALVDRFAAARADVDASNAEIRRASSKRLAELLASADRNALVGGLNDPNLTAYDRQQLSNAIADRLPRRRRRVSATIGHTINRLLRHARYQLRAVGLLVIFLLFMAPVGFLAWDNTGARQVWFDQPRGFVWRFSDGHTETILIPAGTGIVVMRTSNAGQVSLRIWYAPAGYGLSEVPAAWFYENARDWNGRPVNGS